MASSLLPIKSFSVSRRRRRPAQADVVANCDDGTHLMTVAVVTVEVTADVTDFVVVNR